MAVNGGYGGPQFSDVARQLESVAIQFGSIYKLQQQIGASIQTWRTLETELQNARGAAEGTAEDFAKMEKAARSFALASTYSAQQVAGAFYDLASAGLTVQQSLSAMPGVLLLAQATMEEVGQASDTVASALVQFSLSADQAFRVANIFVQSANSSLSTLPKLAYALRQVGPVAAEAGLSIEQTVGILDKLFDAGLRGQMAGTTLRNVLERLSDPTGKAGAILQQLGIRTVDAAGKMVQPIKILEQLAKANIGVADASQLAGRQSAAGFIQMLNSMRDVDKEGNTSLTRHIEKLTGTAAAYNQATLQMNTMNGAILTAMHHFDDLRITLAQGLAPTLISVLDMFSRFEENIHKLDIGKLTVIGQGLALFGIGGVALKGLSTLPAVLDNSRTALDRLSLGAQRANVGLWAVWNTSTKLRGLSVAASGIPEITAGLTSLAGTALGVLGLVSAIVALGAAFYELQQKRAAANLKETAQDIAQFARGAKPSDISDIGDKSSLYEKNFQQLNQQFTDTTTIAGAQARLVSLNAFIKSLDETNKNFGDAIQNAKRYSGDRSQYEKNFADIRRFMQSVSANLVDTGTGQTLIAFNARAKDLAADLGNAVVTLGQADPANFSDALSNFTKKATAFFSDVSPDTAAQINQQMKGLEGSLSKLPPQIRVAFQDNLNRAAVEVQAAINNPNFNKADLPAKIQEAIVKALIGTQSATVRSSGQVDKVINEAVRNQFNLAPVRAAAAQAQRDTLLSLASNTVKDLDPNSLAAARKFLTSTDGVAAMKKIILADKDKDGAQNLELSDLLKLLKERGVLSAQALAKGIEKITLTTIPVSSDEWAADTNRQNIQNRLAVLRLMQASGATIPIDAITEAINDYTQQGYQEDVDSVVKKLEQSADYVAQRFAVGMQAIGIKTRSELIARLTAAAQAGDGGQAFADLMVKLGFRDTDIVRQAYARIAALNAKVDIDARQQFQEFSNNKASKKSVQVFDQAKAQTVIDEVQSEIQAAIAAKGNIVNVQLAIQASIAKIDVDKAKALAQLNTTWAQIYKNAGFQTTTNNDGSISVSGGSTTNVGGQSLLDLFRHNEGSGDSAVSPKGAVGRYQILPGTAKQYDPSLRGLSDADVSLKLKDVGFNTKVANSILADLMKRYDNDLTLVAIAYNAGPGVADAVKNGTRSRESLPGETKKYIQRQDEFLATNPFANNTVGDHTALDALYERSKKALEDQFQSKITAASDPFIVTFRTVQAIVNGFGESLEGATLEAKVYYAQLRQALAGNNLTAARSQATLTAGQPGAFQALLAANVAKDIADIEAQKEQTIQREEQGYNALLVSLKEQGASQDEITKATAQHDKNLKAINAEAAKLVQLSATSARNFRQAQNDAADALERMHNNAPGEGDFGDDTWAGLKAGAHRAAAGMQTDFEVGAKAAQDAIEGLSSAGADAMLGLSGNFAQATSQILQNIAKMIIQMLIMKAIMAAIGFAGGGTGGAEPSVGLGGDYSPTTGFETFALGGIAKYAMGGIEYAAKGMLMGGGVSAAKNPKLAIFGEGQHPEAFIPMLDRKSIPIQFHPDGSMSVPLPSGKSIPARAYADGGSTNEGLMATRSTARKKEGVNGDSHYQFNMPITLNGSATPEDGQKLQKAVVDHVRAYLDQREMDNEKKRIKNGRNGVMGTTWGLRT